MVKLNYRLGMGWGEGETLNSFDEVIKFVGEGLGVPVDKDREAKARIVASFMRGFDGNYDLIDSEAFDYEEVPFPLRTCC
jgi:hypothetical protein